MLVKNLYDYTPINAKMALAIKDRNSNKPTFIWLLKDEEIDCGVWDKYNNARVRSWYAEPNYEDNGTVSMTEPCRIIIEV